MKKFVKVVGIIIFVVLIGFSMSACDHDGGDQTGVGNNNGGGQTPPGHEESAAKEYIDYITTAATKFCMQVPCNNEALKQHVGSTVNYATERFDILFGIGGEEAVKKNGEAVSAQAFDYHVALHE